MSACGVVHVFGNEQPSEFLPLSSWMQQSTFFNVRRPATPPTRDAPVHSLQHATSRSHALVTC
eukprot:5952993-Pleurochrysis_carterae.AAC.2